MSEENKADLALVGYHGRKGPKKIQKIWDQQFSISLSMQNV
jgi:hypothetical protein